MDNGALPDDATLAATVFLSLQEIAHHARAWGLMVTYEAEHEIRFRSPSGMVGGMTTGDDPITRAGVLAFQLAGPGWPRALPTLFARVNRQWKAQSKAARATKEHTDG